MVRTDPAGAVMGKPAAGTDMKNRRGAAAVASVVQQRPNRRRPRERGGRGMSNSRGPDQFEPVDYLGVLRRRWWVWIGVTILCVLGALAYLEVAPKTYTASASVYVTPTAAGQGNNQLANGRTSG